MLNEPIEILNAAAQAIYDKKGFNILGLDVREVSTLTDYLLIAEGGVDRHVIAIANEVIETLKEKGQRPSHVEGLEHGDWVVIDYLDLMIHLFMPGLREKYQLEQLFQEGEIVDLKLKLDD
jgi:ribosome-associated protein